MKEFTAKAKEEIASIQENECCNTALLSALIHSAGSISFSSEGLGVFLTSESQSVVRLVSQLIMRLYGEQGEFSKTDYYVRGSFVLDMLFDLGILTYYGEEIGAMAGVNGFVVNNECCLKSYLKGLFLGCGSVSLSKKYHLEMTFSTGDMAQDVCALIGGFDIIARETKRKDKYVVYIKSSESISDFLALIGANKAVLELNNTAALRMVNMYTNRRINCDMANADKVVETSMKQVAAINKIYASLTDEKLLATAKARIDNPDSSYEGLAEILHVSKGCVKYRLNKLLELAEKSN